MGLLPGLAVITMMLVCGMPVDRRMDSSRTVAKDDAETVVRGNTQHESGRDECAQNNRRRQEACTDCQIPATAKDLHPDILFRCATEDNNSGYAGRTNKPVTDFNKKGAGVVYF